MVYRLILPDWIKAKSDYNPKDLPPVIEGKLTTEDVISYNEIGYNCYYFPNYPSGYQEGTNVAAGDVDIFTSVFIDMDLKQGQHTTKDDFIKLIDASPVKPSRTVDSGNGIHAYWDIADLDGMTYLRLQRRLCRYFRTDDAVSKLCQLMRMPGTVNWKNPDDLKLAELISENNKVYTAGELDEWLPHITLEDEAYCKNHYDKAHGLTKPLDISDELPSKWFKLAKKNSEPWKLFYEQQSDRSIADFRLAHLMLAAEFTKEEAMTVLCQTSKASQRAGIHRYNYAENIVNKVWSSITQPDGMKLLSRRVSDILAESGTDDELKGTRFECDPMVDATEYGFRLTQVLGLIGGAGSGKTMFGLNLFKWFAQRNPEYIHLAVTLEQPELEYAQRWKKMVGNNPVLHQCVEILGNYNEDGTYRHLSLEEIEDYVRAFEKHTGKKIGCVMIDHIGVLKRENRNGDREGLIDICQKLKAFAVNTNTFLVIQSQTSREKAGIGDVELDKDAAYGTTNFEWFTDYVVTIWQPIKRLYAENPNMTVTTFKFAKIRHKHSIKDRIKEDVRYALMYDPETDLLRELTPDEKKGLPHLLSRATNDRRRDKKTEPGLISHIDWTKKTEEVTKYGTATTRDASISRGSGAPSSGQRLPTKS